MITTKLSDLFLEIQPVAGAAKRKRNRALLPAAVLSFWAIRHKPTGYYLPEVYGRQGRGGSYVEPTAKEEKRPRLFVSQRAAKSALGQWLLGRHETSRGFDSGSPYSEPEYYEDTYIVPVPSRKREEMEVIELKLEIP